MKIRTATVIFVNINDGLFCEDEKLCAIDMVADMPTHNGIYKDAMIDVIKWQAGVIKALRADVIKSLEEGKKQ